MLSLSYMNHDTKHKIIGKYFLKCKCEKFQKSVKMLIKCRKGEQGDIRHMNW
jgi:hypothetical protein